MFKISDSDYLLKYVLLEKESLDLCSLLFICISVL